MYVERERDLFLQDIEARIIKRGMNSGGCMTVYLFKYSLKKPRVERNGYFAAENYYLVTLAVNSKGCWFSAIINFIFRVDLPNVCVKIMVIFCIASYR